ncbi:MAG: ACP S-malonyltransferase [Candidatus Hydrogenedentes bacterium]|nr:ACP S-malonyltransferase [Candidatus Hydrogenedentota bacterium]
MSKTAFIFPGQGSQFVGMGTELAEAYPEARRVFDQLGAVLGDRVLNAIKDGPDETLRETHVAQPAILAVSVATYTCLLEQGLQPDAVAGHSLGEYSALVAADVFDFATALRIVDKRAGLMSSAAELCDGSMMAVIGLSAEDVQGILRDARSEGVVELANLNCPGQVVVSGETQALEFVKRAAKEAGAKRVMPLSVSGPFHSSLMKPAADLFADYLRQFTPKEPRIPYVPNVTGSFLDDYEEIPTLLAMQIYRSVLWEDSVLQLIEFGCDRFVEVGPGKVLRGLVRRIDKSVDVISVADPESVEQAVSWAETGK